MQDDEILQSTSFILHIRMSTRGFTTIELLVALLVIGLIGTFAAIEVNAARGQARDAVRLSSVRQIQSGMENYFNQKNMYPPGTEGLALGIQETGCLGEEGFAAACTGATFLRSVPGAVTKGLGGLASCAGEPDAFCYISLQDNSTYRIQFELEGAWPEASLAKGLNCASPDGLTAGACRL